ncbi:hypothetical protein N7520_011470 [Penicillium odoratum]|uniref:uncharacterized protein n=1 Tax=Penicillium odoratum TaxID=1167516 RepID=UPI002546E797|nr:uncharacterized protein N7520_011470 [Penicillium odoratum]KAJ5746288.1 hypothetical protein N7520_011470 [Penicillium odoratum]
MGCFGQVWRFIKAPFTPKERVLEIGPPTNFRKEETPACFSDAESVISPNKNAGDRPILTKELQSVDVSEPSGIDHDEERHNNRDERSPTTDGGKDPSPGAGDERGGVKSSLLSRMKWRRWFKSTPVDDQEGLEIRALDRSADTTVDGQLDATLDRSG